MPPDATRRLAALFGDALPERHGAANLHAAARRAVLDMQS
jgi:hypothetical protein